MHYFFQIKRKLWKSLMVIILPCMMLLLWLVVEDLWDRPRPAGFGSAAAVPEQRKKFAF